MLQINKTDREFKQHERRCVWAFWLYLVIAVYTMAKTMWELTHDHPWLGLVSLVAMILTLLVGYLTGYNAGFDRGRVQPVVERDTDTSRDET